MRILIPMAATLRVFLRAFSHSTPSRQAGTNRSIAGNDMVLVDEAPTLYSIASMMSFRAR